MPSDIAYRITDAGRRVLEDAAQRVPSTDEAAVLAEVAEANRFGILYEPHEHSTPALAKAMETCDATGWVEFVNDGGHRITPAGRAALERWRT